MRRAYCVTAFRVSGNPTVPVGWVLNPRGTFKNLAAETGIPYQNPINLYLRQCAQTGKKPTLSWASWLFKVCIAHPAKLNGGALTLASEPEKGTTATVTLPYE